MIFIYSVFTATKKVRHHQEVLLQKKMKDVCIIGAGVCGLISIKECLASGLKPSCYERAPWTGGLWQYHEDTIEGLSSVAKTTILNSCKEASSFSDFPPPKEYPNYLHNKQMLEYLHQYTKEFGLQKYIHLEHQVLKVQEAEDKWSVCFKDIRNNEEKTLLFDAVMIGSGHMIKPLVPTFPGQDKFKGKILHYHSYKTTAGFEDKDVAVVGIGNSGGDAASELSAVTNKCYLSTRGGNWVVNRVGPFGTPVDLFYIRRFPHTFLELLPFQLKNRIAELTLDNRFDHETYGLKPKHRFFEKHPCVNDTIQFRIISGSVVIKGNIKTFTENGVIFEGENEETPLDIVILATGYEVCFPFLDKSIIDFSKSNFDLFKFVFPTTVRKPETLSFIGFIQPNGAFLPIAELQVRWVCQLLTGKFALPPLKIMSQDIQRMNKKTKALFRTGQRHSNQVDWMTFMDEIAEQFGVRPNLTKLLLTDPPLWSKVFFGPGLPYHYRIHGPGRWDGARHAIMTADERVKAGFSQISRVSPDESVFSFLENCVADVIANYQFMTRIVHLLFTLFLIYVFSSIFL